MLFLWVWMLPNDLRKAYPNYFADTKEFLENLKKIAAKVK